MAETLLHELPWARVLAGNNELKIRAKSSDEVGPEAADAVALRFQVPVENLAGSGWVGAIFADILQGSSADGPTERVQLKLGFKMDPGSTLELYATRLNGSNDSDEIRIFRFALDGAEFGVPLKGIVGDPASLGSGVPSMVTRFYTDHGKFMVNWQDDTGQPSGIVYDMQSGTPVAVGRVLIEMFPIEP